MAELNVLLLICNEKFEPCAITLPYYRPTNTELLRRQIEWTPEWKTPCGGKSSPPRSAIKPRILHT